MPNQQAILEASHTMTVARTCRVHVHNDRIDDYLTFLEEWSVPFPCSSLFRGVDYALHQRERDALIVVRKADEPTAPSRA